MRLAPDMWIVLSLVQLERQSFISCLMEHCFSHRSPLHQLSLDFCTQFFSDLHTESDGHLIFAESFNESEPQRNIARRACGLAAWPNKALLQVMSPSLSLTSAVSTRRSISRRERTASTRTTAILRLQWLRLKESTQTWDKSLHHCLLRRAK